MTKKHPQPITRREGVHFKYRKKRKGLKIFLALLICCVIILSFIGGSIFHLKSNITTEPLNLSVVSPQINPVIDVAVAPTNILILGTDTRKGNGQYGTEEDSSGYGASDVMLLLHLYADKKSATVISFPRDLMAPLPACKDPETNVTTPAVDSEQLNNALKIAGPGCTVAAISELTGLTIDHMMLADFNAVKELSNTIGGVQVCVTKAVDDEKSGLKIPAGVSEVQGEQALAFLRTRSAFGDGSDLGRIRAQQSFLASLARKVTSNDTLTNIPKLYSIADTITKNLTVDEGLAHVPELLKIADRMKKLDLSQVQFITIPNEPYVNDPNRVQVLEAEAQPIFDSLKADKLITEEKPSPSPSPVATESALPQPGEVVSLPPTDVSMAPAPMDTSLPEPTVEPIDPSLINVLVDNRSGKKARDAEVQTVLSTIGYIASIGSNDDILPSTQILYAYGDKDIALQVAKDLGVSPANVQHSLDATMVTVVVGEDFTVGKKVYSSSGLGESISGQTASDITCNIS